VTELTLMPDIEELVVAYLRSRSELQDLNVKVTDEVQQNARFAQVMLGRIGGTGMQPNWLDPGRIQVDVRAQTKRVAHSVAVLVRALLEELPGTDNDFGVVSDVEDDLGLQWLPDPSVKPPRPRYVFGVIVRVHPLTDQGS